MLRKLVVSILAVAAVAVPSAASAGGTPLPRGGDYLLLNPRNAQVVYVGRSSNLGARMAYWQERQPFLVEKIVVRSDSFAVQKGAEQVLWERYSAVARSQGRQLLNKVSPMNMRNAWSNRNFRENMDYYLLGREWIEEHGLVTHDPSDWAPIPLVRALVREQGLNENLNYTWLTRHTPASGGISVQRAFALWVTCIELSPERLPF